MKSIIKGSQNLVSQQGKFIEEAHSKSKKNRKEPREIHRSLGPRIKYFRERKKLSLHDLEERTGISASYINRLENNYRKAPSYPILELIADALEIPIYELLNFPKPTDILRSVGELILVSDYKVENRIASPDLKAALSALVDTVLESDFEKNWNQTAFEIIEKAQAVIQAMEER